MRWGDPTVQALFWSTATIALYLASKRLYRRFPSPWLMPLGVAPVLLGIVLVALHGSYRQYISGTSWLVALLGPTTVAFAVPIYEKRALLRRHWPVLVIGTFVGSLTAIATGWALSTALGLDGVLRLSLMPRSMSTPFAMEVSGDIGGVPDLTACFVAITGVLGGVIGDFMLAWLPVRSSLARGALLGLGAHGVGTARAYVIGQEEGSVAGLVMVMVGLTSVMVAPFIGALLR